MGELFLTVLNMSLTASYVILFVITFAILSCNLNFKVRE